MLSSDLRFYPLNCPEQSYLIPHGSRGCRQTLEPLERFQGVRSLAGTLDWVSPHRWDKYGSSIEVEDTYPMAFEGLWPGMILMVECIPRLMTPWLNEGTFPLQRPCVAHSLLFHPAQGEPYRILPQKDQKTVTLSSEQGPGHLSYRPLLTMMIENFSLKTKEWEGLSTWHIKLVEI